LVAREPVRHHVAWLISSVAAPGPVAGALLLGVACYSTKTVAEGLALGTLLAACATVPPSVYIERVLVRKASRRRHLAQSSERLLPLAIGCVSVLLAGVVVGTLDVSRELPAVLHTMLFVLGLVLAATPLTRVSVHMAAVTGAIVILQLLFGAIGVALLPLIVLVGWSRLQLREHTPLQVVCGAVIGATGAGTAYGLLG